MAKVKIKIEMDEKKVNPLKYFIGKENTSIEEELQKTMDELYLKHVPAEMREYIEHDLQDNAQVQEQSNRSARSSRVRSSRANTTSRRAQGNVISEETVVEVNEPSENLNTQGMSM